LFRYRLSQEAFGYPSYVKITFFDILHIYWPSCPFTADINLLLQRSLH